MAWRLKVGSKLQNRGVRSCILSYTFTISITALNPTKWRLFKCTAVVIEEKVNSMSALAINQSFPYFLIILIAWLNEVWDTDQLYVPWLYVLLAPFFFFSETRVDISYSYFLFFPKKVANFFLSLITNFLSALSPTIFCSNFAGCSL